GAEVRRLRAQPFGERGVVARYVVAPAPRVRRDPGGAGRRLELDARGAVLHIGALRGAAVAHAHRRGPGELLGTRADRAQPLLAQRKRRLLGAVEGDVDERHARLLDEAAEHRERLGALAGRPAERADEVLGGGVAERVALEIGAHALA